MLAWLVVIVGFLYVLFQIFLSSGGKTKFKSDLPKTDILTNKKKMGVKICLLSLCAISLVMLVVAMISFLS